MAYISYDRDHADVGAPRLAWGRLAMIGASAAFWIIVAAALRAIL